MYGMVNKAIEEMIRSRFGEETWEEVKRRSGVDVDVFVSNDSYPDEVTYAMVGAASKVLGVPADEVLAAFGEHWILVTARDGYGGLLHATGRDMTEFLTNLPGMHTRVAMIFPNLRPPRFRCVPRTTSSIEVHYHTERPGLTSFVVGLLHGLARMFEVDAHVEILERHDRGADHDVFLVEWAQP